MIAIINYNAGNITSVARALQNIGQDFVITDDTKKLDAASHVIFPGVARQAKQWLICAKKNSIPG